jgi:putative transposase
LIDNLAMRLKELIELKAKELGILILALEIMPNHVHLFVSCTPQIAANQIMFRLKGYTSRMLRKEYPYLMRMPSLWTRSYFVSTAGNVSAETIRKYIEAQTKT